MARKKIDRVEDWLGIIRDQIWFLKNPKFESITAIAAVKNTLFDAGDFFEELALDAASRGERVALFERLALAFRRKRGTIDLGCLPCRFVQDCLNQSGEIVREDDPDGKIWSEAETVAVGLDSAGRSDCHEFITTVRFGNGADD